MTQPPIKVLSCVFKIRMKLLHQLIKSKLSKLMKRILLLQIRARKSNRFPQACLISLLFSNKTNRLSKRCLNKNQIEKRVQDSKTSTDFSKITRLTWKKYQSRIRKHLWISGPIRRRQSNYPNRESFWISTKLNRCKSQNTNSSWSVLSYLSFSNLTTKLIVEWDSFCLLICNKSI